MPFVSVPDTAEIIIQGDIAGQPIANVVGAAHIGLYTQADLDVLATDVDSWVETWYKPMFANSVQYNQTHVRGLNTIIDLESADGSSVGPGTRAGGGMPANASFCVTLRTGKTGRSARGRFYAWPYTTTDLVTSQTVTSTYANDIATAVDQLRLAISGAGFQMVIISRRSGNAPRTVGVTTPVTQVQSRNIDIDSMRHRLLRGH